MIIFSDNYLINLGSATESMMFRQYIVLSARLNATIIAKSFGINQDDFLKTIPEMNPKMEMDETKKYLVAVLKRVIEVRDAESKNRYNSILNNALK